MNIPKLMAMLSMMGANSIDAQTQRDRDHLTANGWICLGEEAITGVVHWTNMERGLAAGGPVTFQRAIWLQRTADAIAQRKPAE